MHSAQVKNKRIETVNCSKSAAIEPELYCKKLQCTSAADIVQINVQLTNSARYNKTANTP